ncbi:MAG: ThiF family adenylyltransferase, partial [Selenomonas sp.]|nr:ThiF family adenylyltransferase [Selenomonas sp.]
MSNIHRFSRSELLLGREGLARLASATVAVFGVGGVGSFVVEGLARAGVGHLVLVDNDKISLTNINRQ